MPKESGKLDSHAFYPTSSYQRQSQYVAAGLGTSAKSVFDGIFYGGLKLEKAAAYKLLGLDTLLGSDSSPVKEAIDTGMKAAEKDVSKISNGIFDHDNFWLQTHPSRKWMDNIDTMVGEAIVQLPLYEAIGSARTTMMAEGAIKSFVGRRLADGADAYIGAMLQNKDQASALHDVAAFMGFGALAEGAGAAIKIPTRYLVKQYTSRMAAMGGRPFVDAVVDKATQSLEKGIVEDNKTVKAEQLTLTAMGREKYGKAWNQLSQAQRKAIRTARDKISAEAVQEVPIHNKDLAKLHTDHVEQQAKDEYPEYAALVKQAEAMTGLKVSDEVFKSEQEQMEAINGIKQTQGTVKSIARSGKRPTPVKVANPATEEEPRKFAQLRSNTISYFVNRARSSGGTASLAREIKDMDSDEFVDQIMSQMGEKAKFENPEHALLWANSFRTELPKPFQKRLIEELHEMNPNETIKVWDEQSKNLDTHMQELAYTGRLFSQGNIFRSTQVDKWLSKSKWQTQLREEVEAKELKELKAKMHRHPKEFKEAAQVMQHLQAFRRKAANAQDYEKFTEQIRGK